MTFYDIVSEAKNIRLELYDRRRQAESQRENDFLAAFRIQKWFRGIRVRCYLKILNELATTIQKHWRGFAGRRHYRKLLKDRILELEVEYYNYKATVIQKTWRGWYIRNHVFDFKLWKDYFLFVDKMNQFVKKETTNYWQSDKNPRSLHDKWMLKLVKAQERRKHHLLSTEHIPGIYLQKNKPHLQQIERWHRSQKPILKLREMIRVRAPSLIPPMPPNMVKPQGPFKDPATVHKLKHQPRTYLRMLPEDNVQDTTFEQINATKWIHDEPFIVAAQRCHEDLTPLLYKLPPVEIIKPPDYGRKHFRETDPTKNLSFHLHVASKQ